MGKQKCRLSDIALCVRVRPFRPWSVNSPYTEDQVQHYLGLFSLLLSALTFLVVRLYLLPLLVLLQYVLFCFDQSRGAIVADAGKRQYQTDRGDTVVSFCFRPAVSGHLWPACA